MFDDRVLTFGLFIENKMNETDSKGRRKHKSIAPFLEEPKERKAGTLNLDALGSVRGIRIRG